MARRKRQKPGSRCGSDDWRGRRPWINLRSWKSGKILDLQPRLERRSYPDECLSPPDGEESDHEAECCSEDGDSATGTEIARRFNAEAGADGDVAPGDGEPSPLSEAYKRRYDRGYSCSAA